MQLNILFMDAINFNKMASGFIYDDEMLSQIASGTYSYKLEELIYLDKIFAWLFGEDFNTTIDSLLEYKYKIVNARYGEYSKGEYSLKGKGFQNCIELILLKQENKERVKVKIFKGGININNNQTSRPVNILELILNMLKHSLYEKVI